jgi:hypothetical protein
MDKLLSTLPIEIKYSILSLIIPLDFAAKKNIIAVFKSLDAKISHKQSKRAWYGAVKYSRRQILKILIDKKIKPPGDITTFAAKFPDVGILHYVMKYVNETQPCNNRMIKELSHSIIYDRVDNFIYLINITIHTHIPNKWEDLNLITLISAHISKKILKWVIHNFEYVFNADGIRSNYINWLREILMNEVVRIGDLADIFYFIDKKIIHPYAIELAASRGFLDFIIVMMPYRRNNHFLIDATIAGHIHILMHFRELVVFSLLIFPAVMLQHLHIIKWLFEEFPEEASISTDMYNNITYTKNKKLIELCNSVRKT